MTLLPRAIRKGVNFALDCLLTIEQQAGLSLTNRSAKKELLDEDIVHALAGLFQFNPPSHYFSADLVLLLVAYYRRERGQDATAEVRRFVTAKLNASAQKARTRSKGAARSSCAVEEGAKGDGDSHNDGDDEGQEIEI